MADPDNDLSSLEEARRRLYKPAPPHESRAPLPQEEGARVPHAWEERVLRYLPHQGERRVRLAGLFFMAAILFFFASLVIAGFFFFFGGNTVSVDKVRFDIQGPTSISGGDTVPLSLTITNTNTATIENVVLEIDFPSGTRDADNVLAPYPRYSEELGKIGSGASVTRSVKAVLFGKAGQSVTIPISLSYEIAGSNAVFVKKSSYTLTVGTTPLEVSVDTLSETVANKPLNFTLTVRSNASIPIANVVLVADFPFGFTVTSSSMPMTNDSFLLGTLAPGQTKTVTLTGTLAGQDREQRVFHFTVGTANTPNNQTLAVTYMTQEATIALVAPFISTALSINGDTRAEAVISPGSVQNVTVNYANTLSTSIENASVVIGISGSAVDYDSIRTSNGFYRSADRTIVFSRDTDPSLASLAPGATGIGAFTFSTLPAVSLGGTPTVRFTVSVSGTRTGQTNVPELVTASLTRTVKVVTNVALSAFTLRTSGPFSNTGPIPPKADQATTYTIGLSVRNSGSAVAGGAVSMQIPNYVAYTGVTSGSGSISYNEVAHTVTWNTGDLGQGLTAQAFFQVSLVPSTSQRGTAPQLTGPIAFTGFDRFAGVQITASADPVTTDTPRDPGYSPTNAAVQ